MKAPFPYFGGKAIVADIIWQALGDCGHYIEPFCGSCAVLWARPGHDPTKHVETVNDADGHLANVWRALQAAPDEVAKWCDWPVNHADLMARKKRLNANTESLLEKLCKDDEYYDPLLAGYYIWAASCWIGNGLIRPNQIPHLSGGGGMGVHAKGQHGGIYEYFQQLSARLRYVRVVCGDWSRVCGGDWQTAPGKPVGIFFDPPYSDKAERTSHLYGVDCLQVAHTVREWCLKRGERADHRIVLAGYVDEHASEMQAAGWRLHRWSADGGYANTQRKAGSKARGKENRHEEALWFSPYCGCEKDLLSFASAKAE